MIFLRCICFFDYDGHNNNLPGGKDPNEFLNQILMKFDNETELGKMYVSYPMVEAIKHFSYMSKCLEVCDFAIDNFTKYKMQVSKVNNKHYGSFSTSTWEYAIKVFVKRVSCLYGQGEIINFDKYREIVTSYWVLEKQYNNFIKPKKTVMILSALPQFIIDYFKKEEVNKYFSELIADENQITCVSETKIWALTNSK